MAEEEGDLFNDDPFADDGDNDGGDVNNGDGGDGRESEDRNVNLINAYVHGDDFDQPERTRAPLPMSSHAEFEVQRGPIPKEMGGSEDLTATQMNDMQSAINDLGTRHGLCVSTNMQAESEAELVTYQVIVHTGSIRGAGTDASIFITIFGENVS